MAEDLHRLSASLEPHPVRRVAHPAHRLAWSCWSPSRSTRDWSDSDDSEERPWILRVQHRAPARAQLQEPGGPAPDHQQDEGGSTGANPAGPILTGASPERRHRGLRARGRGQRQPRPRPSPIPDDTFFRTSPGGGLLPPVPAPGVLQLDGGPHGHLRGHGHRRAGGCGGACWRTRAAAWGADPDEIRAPPGSPARHPDAEPETGDWHHPRGGRPGSDRRRFRRGRGRRTPSSDGSDPQGADSNDGRSGRTPHRIPVRAAVPPDPTRQRRDAPAPPRLTPGPHPIGAMAPAGESGEPPIPVGPGAPDTSRASIPVEPAGPGIPRRTATGTAGGNGGTDTPPVEPEGGGTGEAPVHWRSHWNDLGAVAAVGHPVRQWTWQPHGRHTDLQPGAARRHPPGGGALHGHGRWRHLAEQRPASPRARRPGSRPQVFADDCSSVSGTPDPGRPARGRE